MLNQIEKRLKEINGGLVLDVATGTGEFIDFIKEFASYDKIIAIDKMDKMKDLFNQRFRNEKKVEFKVMDAEYPDFANNTFDTICISNSLHHFKNIDFTLKQLSKILKPGGLIIINEMQSNDLTPSQKSHNMIHRFFAKLDVKKGMFHNPTLTSNKIIKIASNLNFSNVEIFDYAFTIPEEHRDSQTIGLINMLHKQDELLKTDAEYNDLHNEIKQIIEYLNKYSYSPAKSVFIVAQKSN